MSGEIGRSGEIEMAGIRIAQSDWETTPKSVKGGGYHLVSTIGKLSEQEVAPLVEHIGHFNKRIAHLEEQLSKDSKNSSKI
ncbi:hypothetical protein [Halomicronema hongdechloris]|uniref:hypothetical protein n=1 Tax=Halomicronema hongdechloris TaxID=1209493 RepID=UPI0009BB9B6C|nr:hypothetical protein [Halomicronema hongdechloris]